MDVGSELKVARAARGLSLADLAAATRIRASLIEAIERNDFDACGGEVFARGHVRALATALEIDAGPLLTAMGAVNAATTLQAVEPDSIDIWEMQSRAHVPSETRTWTAVVVAALAIVGALVWRTHASAAPPTLDPKSLPSVTSTATATVTPEATPTDSATASASPTASATPTKTPTTGEPVSTGAAAIVVQLDCNATSWVRISNASGTLFQGTMRPGERKRLTSETDVTVRIGNAAGVSLTVNDMNYGALGAPGAVYSRTFQVG